LGVLADGIAGTGALPPALERGVEAARTAGAGGPPPLALAGDLLAHIRAALNAAARQSSVAPDQRVETGERDANDGPIASSRAERVVAAMT
jgi:hypothetical protein